MHFATRILLCGLCCTSLWAQQSKHSLKGYLIGQASQKPLDYASLLLRNPRDSSLVTGVQTKVDGSFILTAPAGHYLLELRALGYQSQLRPLELKGALDLGTIYLLEEAKQLQGVQVSAKRPIIQRKLDRLSFDPEQLAPGASNALDLLRETPSIKVSDQGISIIGKGSVIILINGKRVRLSGAALTSLLRSYSREALSEVQILDAPPAKYEAEGNAGVLNIVLKKAHKGYFGGSVSTNLNDLEGHWTYGGSLGLNYQQGKVTSSLQLSAGTGYYPNELMTSRSYTHNPLLSESYTQLAQPNEYGNLRATLDYQLHPDLSIGGNLSLSPSHKQNLRSNLTQDYQLLASGDHQLLRRIPGAADDDKRQHYNSAGLHLDYSPRQHPGRSLTWEFDYIGFASRDARSFDSKSYNPQGQVLEGQEFRFSSLGKQRTRAYYSGLDYEQPLGQGRKLGFGTSLIWSRTYNDNDYDARSSIGAQSYSLRFDEQVYGLYGDYTHPLSKLWMLRTGLRLEYTHTSGRVQGQQLKPRQYFNLFPTLFVGFNPNERHGFSLSSNVRLERPYFGQLNPFPSYENRYNTIRGKEDLKPSKQANLRLGYTYGGWLDMQLVGNYRWDGITQVVRLDPKTNQGEYRHENGEVQRRFALESSIFVPYSFGQSYIGQRIVWSDTRIIPEGSYLYSSKGWNYGIDMNHTLYLNRPKTLQATLSLSYSSPSNDGGVRVEHIFTSGLGLKYSLLEGRLRLSAGISNLLGRDVHARLSNSDYALYFVNTNPKNVLRFGIDYSFGSKIKSKQQKDKAQSLRSRI